MWLIYHLDRYYLCGTLNWSKKCFEKLNLYEAIEALTVMSNG